MSLVSFQTCPVDLTRTLEHNQKRILNASSDTESETPKRLAFSVENILDPNKFTGSKKIPNGSGIHCTNRIWSGFDRDELSRDRFDDESESHSGKQPKMFKQY